MSDKSLPRLFYFADAMCSWCYGFAPEMDRVLAALDGRARLIVQSGGLRPFHTEPMTEEDKPRFRGYREQVQAASGQPFDWSFFDREGYVMDTEPASRAVVTIRAMEKTPTATCMRSRRRISPPMRTSARRTCWRATRSHSAWRRPFSRLVRFRCRAGDGHP